MPERSVASPHRGAALGASCVLVVCCAVMAVGFHPDALWRPDADGHAFNLNQLAPGGDAAQFAERWEAARVSIIDFHQFPFWNPWFCGGVSLFGDAEATFPGPGFLLTFFWLPAATGINVFLLLYLFVGALGAAMLVRDQGANLPEQVLAGAVVAGCSQLAYHFDWEHLSFAPFLLMPWILWAHRRALVDLRWSVLVAVLLASGIDEGGVNPVPIIAVALAADSIARLPHRGERRALLRALSVTALLTALLAAPRLLAVWQILRDHRGLMGASDGMTVAEVFRAWTTFTRPSPWTHEYSDEEFPAHVGLVPVGLMLLGAAAALFVRDESTRRRRIDLFALLICCWLALGFLARPSLYAGLHKLPVFSSLRVSPRFLFPSVVFLALLAVSALQLMRAWATTRLGRFGAGLFVAIEICVATGVTASQVAADIEAGRVAGLHPSTISASPALADFRQVATSGGDAVASFPAIGRGTSACYHPQYRVQPAPGLRLGDVPQQWISPEDGGSVRAGPWTPNALTYDVSLSRPALLVINQNFDRWWQTSVGRTLDVDGLLAVELPAGDHAVAVRQGSHRFGLGLLLMMVGIGLALVVLSRPRLQV